MLVAIAASERRNARELRHRAALGASTASLFESLKRSGVIIAMFLSPSSRCMGCTVRARHAAEELREPGCLDQSKLDWPFGTTRSCRGARSPDCLGPDRSIVYLSGEENGAGLRRGMASRNTNHNATPTTGINEPKRSSTEPAQDRAAQNISATSSAVVEAGVRLPERGGFDRAGGRRSAVGSQGLQRHPLSLRIPGNWPSNGRVLRPFVHWADMCRRDLRHGQRHQRKKWPMRCRRRQMP